jgi:hypothetical protein
MVSDLTMGPNELFIAISVYFNIVYMFCPLVVHYHVLTLTDDTADFASHFAGKADNRVL